ncbi:MAG: FprA family A-type flavoprotein [Sarcina sp.]
MQHLNIKENIYWVGAQDPNLRVFDIIMYTPFGTTYNSYVVKGSEKVALFETVKIEFFDEYLSKLKELNVDIHNIDYIIVSHTEPDHSGSIDKILELSPNAKIVASPIALKYLSEIVNKDFKSIAVKDGDSLSLGDKTLKFLSVPNLHWPDTIYTYLEEDKMLITCDSFGSHYSCKEMFDDLIPSEADYMEALKYYFDCIMGPFKPHMLKAIAKIDNLEINTICPGHGPILRNDPWKIINLYKQWSAPLPENKIKKATIFYVSAYGYTEILAKEISKGIHSTGDFEVNLYNVIDYNIDELVEVISTSDAILFGSPTIVNELLEPIRILLAKLNPIVHGGKVSGAFGSYGWSGEAVPRIETRLTELRMKLPAPGLKIKFKPSEKDLTQAFDFGVAIGNATLKNK